LAKSKSTTIVSQQASEAVKERLKHLNDLESKNRTESIDQTSSDEENDKVRIAIYLKSFSSADWLLIDWLKVLARSELEVSLIQKFSKVCNV